ncbi:MAG: hypothetical protein HS104_22520 [Polyangiaceae bacterium]|nr:hypothetical protein [Polyangiaceae bacterium]MCL4750064.1 hypothetical protein [Myxococcales bacterium]
MRSPALLVCLGLASCRTPSTTSAPAPSAAASTPSASAPPTGPPAPERACSRDDECAVARIEVSGEHACCGACATTAGTRRWHAELQRYCAAHPPSNCSPLACPMGPTFARCQEGRCVATASGPDGGPAFVVVERRCLPAVVCDGWAGCARALGNDQDGWFVEESERASRGEIVGRERVAVTDGGVAEVFRSSPPGVKCPPHAVPPLFPPAPVCAEVDGRCKAR